MENRRVIVLFGSETGNAQDVAERLHQDAKRRLFQSEIHEMDDFSVKKLPSEPLVVFVCSTTGQGEEPNNMKIFWKFVLRRNLPKNSLSNVKVAVLGLGDSSYQKFNFAAKKLFRRLIQLGATAVVPLGLADDQHDFGYDSVAEFWITEFWSIIDSVFPLPYGTKIIPQDVLLPPKYKIIPETSNMSEFSGKISGFAENAPFFAPLISSDRVTPLDHFQDTRLIRLDISECEISYSPGDVVLIQPKNLSECVSKFLELVQLEEIDLDSKFRLESTDAATKLPPEWLISKPTSLRECIESFFDLQCIPKRSFFRFLSHFAVSELEKEKIHEFCTPEGQEDLHAYCNRPRRTVVEVLEDFHDTAARIPKEYLFDLLSPIRPRAFSIASCQNVHKGELQLLVAVVKYKTRLSAHRQGLCSTWLSRLTPGTKVPIFFRKGALKFPESSEKCVMIGPGTGIAPFRSFIQDRFAKGFKQNLLFFGCRNKEKDFYFQEEWKALEKQNFLILKTAFSRDQSQKIYVQHRLRENGPLIWEWLSDVQAHVFVAGNANQMPKDVTEALKEICISEGGISEIDAENFVSDLDKSGQLQLETWS